MIEAFYAQTEAMRTALNDEMKAVLKFNGEQPDLFHGMMHYHMGWVDENLQPEQVNAGKQIRPILLLLTCQAAGGDWQQAVPAAAAIELVHNFSLIHDDIEDASPTRRGRLTAWKIWGIEQSINAGDAMFALAHIAMNRLFDRGVPAEIVVKALRRFDETCVHLTQGQNLDMAFETMDVVQVDEYIKMITGKTAVLLSLCTELGALIAGADAETVENYHQFGLQTGLAFQMKDDILGIWGDEAVIGKSASTDISTKKKTLPVLYGLAESADLRQLYGQVETNGVFVETAVSLLTDCGARDYATTKAIDYTDSALAHLEASQPQGKASELLKALVNFLLERNY